MTIPVESMTAGSPSRRLFVVDHMCVLPYGHNQGAMAIFRRELAPEFTESHALVPRTLRAASAQERGFTRCLNYPYNAFFYRRFGRWLARWVKREQARASIQRWLRRMEKVGLTALAAVLRFDPVLWATERNWKRQFRDYGIGANDLIFFPGADFYGAGACLDVLLDRIARSGLEQTPQVHLRMVGVMEHASLRSGPACEQLLAKASKAIAFGAAISVSTETPAYAVFLAERLGARVDYFPYPLSGDALPMPQSRPPVAAAIGSGRGDKGFLLWAEIVRETARRSAAPVRFELQAMPVQERDFADSYQTTLAALPGVRLLPAMLLPEQLRQQYMRSSVVVLPYDPYTYRLRGSAIFQEALAYGRPVICLEGAAFAELIKRYQNGYVCRDIGEVAGAIAACVAIPPAEWERRLAAARALYAVEVEEAVARLTFEPFAKLTPPSVPEGRLPSIQPTELQPALR